MDAVLQEMLDEFALRRLVNTYCRAVDRGDIDLLRRLYHEDAADAHGGFSSGSADDFFQQLVASRPYIRAMQHHITTANFAISGHAAEGEIYSIAVHTFAGRGRDTDLVIGGRYLDKYEKRSDTWKLLERTIVTDWARFSDPSAMDMSHPVTKDTLKGALDETDPSYQFFALFAGPPPTTDRSSSSHSSS